MRRINYSRQTWNSSREWLIEISHSLSNFSKMERRRREDEKCWTPRETFFRSENLGKFLPILPHCFLKAESVFNFYTQFGAVGRFCREARWKNVHAAINDYLLYQEKAHGIFIKASSRAVSSIKMGVMKLNRDENNELWKMINHLISENQLIIFRLVFLSS